MGHADMQRFSGLVASSLEQREGAVADPWQQYANRLGERIRLLRRTKGVSQGTACNAVGMSVDTWSRLERGDGQEPKLSTLMRVADALDVELADLFPERASNQATPCEHEVLNIVKYLAPEEQDALLKILRRT